MGGSNKEHTLIDSIRNGDSQTAVKILQNSMINSTNKTNQSFLKSRLLNHKLVKHADLASSSLTSITSSSRNRSLSVDCSSNLNASLRLNKSTIISGGAQEIIELNRVQSTSNSNLNNTKRKKHANKLFDIKSLNTNNKLITKVFQYYDENNFNTLRTKLNLNYQDESGKSIIHEACINGNQEIVKLIIESGSKLNQYDSKGYAPMHYACLHGKIDLATLLIQNGVDCNEPTLIGNDTPLHLAIQHSLSLSTQLAEKLVSLLLTSGGDLSLCISNKHHQLTPFELACELGLTNLVSHILKYSSQTSKENKPLIQLILNYSLKSLHLAAKNGHDEIIRLLLIYNVCDINRVISLHDMNGTCLHEAARYGRLQTVKLLLESGADTRLRNSLDQHALDVVIKQKTGGEIKCLIQEYAQSVHAISVACHCSTRAGSLNFDLNELIVVLDRAAGKTDSFWRGFILNKLNFTTKYGYFPSTHVRLVDLDEKTVNSNSPSSSSSSSSSSTISSPSSMSSSIGVVSVTHMLRSGMNDSQIVFNWLRECQLEQYYESFVRAGYDLLTIARGTTPADLCAIGVANPLHRQILKQNMQRLNTKDLEDKLNCLLVNVHTIEDLFKLIHLEQYLDAINELKLFQNLNDLVSTVSLEDLEEIGFKLGHQKKLMHVVKCFKEVIKKRDLTQREFGSTGLSGGESGLARSLENLSAKLCLSNLQVARETAILNSPPRCAPPQPPRRVDSIMRPSNPPPAVPPRVSSCVNDKSLSSYATLPRNRKQPLQQQQQQQQVKSVLSGENSTLSLKKTSSPLSNSNKIELKFTEQISVLNTSEPSVLTDIDNMLCDLNKQLDDMLDYDKIF